MALLDVQLEKKEFRARLDSGGYAEDRSTNSEVDYREKKQERDTKAVYEFTQSPMFDYIRELR